MTLVVIHTFGRNAGVVAKFDKPVVRFGRAPDNDVVFDPEYDRDASGKHAELRFENGAWVLIDLGSRNGTWVRGERVQRAVLAPGEEVTFGARGPRVRLEFAAASAAPVGPEAGGGRPSGTALMEPAARAQVLAPPVQAAPVQVSAPPVRAAPAQVAAPAPAPGHAVASPAAAPFVAPVSPNAVAAFRASAPSAAPAFAPPAAGVDPARPAAVPPPGAPAGACPAPVAPPAGARVGQRTIAQMIESAVLVATGRSRPKKTQEIAALVDQQVEAATARYRRSFWLLGGLLVVVLAGLAALVLWERKGEDEIARLRQELASLPPDDPRRKEIEGRLGTLHPSNANFGRNLYDRSKKGIFMLAAGGRGFCTAFAVRPSLLATNAHCIFAARRIGGAVVALENEGRGEVRFGVTDMRPHPAYRDQDEDHLTPDVGVVEISGKAAAVLELAGPDELAAAGAGDDVYLIGFPGRLMDAQNPGATFLAAHVGRITNANGRPGPFAESWLVQHDAATTQGTSGSPIFNGRGKVIAVNAGGYTEADAEKIAGKKTEVVKASPYKFGMRVDLLAPLLR